MPGPFIDFSCSLNMGLTEVMCASAGLSGQRAHMNALLAKVGIRGTINIEGFLWIYRHGYL